MKLFRPIIILVVFNQLALSQAVERFHFSLPQTLISNSKYTAFEFIDSRSDTANFGKVYSDHYKRKVPLVTDINLSKQLNWLVRQVLDTSASKGVLLFQLRKIQFVELGGEIPNYGYCPLRVELYVNKNSNYLFLDKLDTFLVAEKNIDRCEVTESLLKQSKAVLNSFVLRNLPKEPRDKNFYSREQLFKIDSIEKSVLPLYKTQNYIAGAYLSYESFKRQMPDHKLLKISRKNGEIQMLTIEDKKGKAVNVNFKEVYAFVYNDTCYIADQFGCYSLQKKNNEFYFVGKGKTLPNPEGATLSDDFTGILSEKASKSTVYAFFNAMIDHCDGSVIWYEKIK